MTVNYDVIILYLMFCIQKLNDDNGVRYLYVITCG